MNKKPIIFVALMGGVLLLAWLLFGRSEKERLTQEPLEQETRERLKQHLEVEHPDLPAEERLEKAEKRMQKPPEEWTMEDIEAHYPNFKFTEEEKRLKPAQVSAWHWFQGIGLHQGALSRNGPIEFYGKVVDTEGKPIEGVNLIAEISYDEPSIQKVMETKGESSRRKTLILTTNEEGEFQVKGEKGRGIMLASFEKKGYEVQGRPIAIGIAKYWGFNYNPESENLYQSDPNNPVEFVMVKTVGQK